MIFYTLLESIQSMLDKRLRVFFGPHPDVYTLNVRIPPHYSHDWAQNRKNKQ